MAEIWPVVTGLPSGQEWDFGGCEYGLEPLTLPQPDSARVPPAVGAGADLERTRARIAAVDIAVVDDLAPGADNDELFGFRWITGHQVSFVLWQQIRSALADAEDGGLGDAAALDLLHRYVRGYSAMLIYTGSCPRQTYQTVLRPSMRLRHPAFSGGWAADYRPVQELLRSGRSPLTNRARRRPPARRLKRAISVQHAVHGWLAARLVPDGRSLLQRSPAVPDDRALAELIFDNYFLTLRAPVPTDDVVAQLLRRLLAIRLDLARNGLYRGGRPDSDEQAARLRTDEIVACERALPDILDAVAEGAVTALPRPALAGGRS